MRLIYDGSDGAEVTVEKIRFRAGKVTADLPARLVEKFLSMPHLKIRLATKDEIEMADTADGIARVNKVIDKSIDAIRTFTAKLEAIPKPAPPKKANPDRPAAKAVEEIEE